MSKITYLHREIHEKIVDGKRTIHEEMIIDGPKGLTFKLYIKNGEKETKISGIKKNGDFIVNVKKGDKKETVTLDRKEFLEMLKKEKELDFAKKYIETLKGGARKEDGCGYNEAGMCGGAKRRSRKTSRRTSRKTTRSAKPKTSRKGSRRSSRK